jgi:hypothetical protein
VLLFDNLLVQNIDTSDHKQAKIIDNVSSQRIVLDGVAIYVESKTLTLYSSAIRKLHGEIEGDALVYHSTSCHQEAELRER